MKCKDGTMFVHANEVFRSNVTQFVNDTKTHPILKYQAFIITFILVVSGLLILLLFNGERIFGHSYWKHWFSPLVIRSTAHDDDDDDDDDIFDGYGRRGTTDAAIFRKAIEGMTNTKTSTSTSTTTTKDGKTITKDGKFVNADTDAAEKQKKTPCGTDCGQYIILKGKINELAKYVNAVKDQTEEIKQTETKLQELGKQIQDLNKSLAPGGAPNITMK